MVISQHTVTHNTQTVQFRQEVLAVLGDHQLHHPGLLLPQAVQQLWYLDSGHTASTAHQDVYHLNISDLTTEVDDLILGLNICCRSQARHTVFVPADIVNGFVIHDQHEGTKWSIQPTDQQHGAPVSEHGQLGLVEWYLS